MKPPFAICTVVAATTLGFLFVAFGPITLPIVFFAVLVLPWLMKDAFRLFVWLIVTWPLLTPFLRIPMPAGMPDISYDRVFFFMLVGLVIFEVFLSRTRPCTRFTPLDMLILAYLVAQLPSHLLVFWFGGTGALEPNIIVDALLRPVAMYWIAKNLLVSRLHIRRFLQALLITSLLICLTGLYEQAVRRKVSFEISGRTTGTDLDWDDGNRMRATGVLDNPAVYGATMGMGILAGICCLYNTKRHLTRLLFVATLGVLLYGVFVSYTRSAWLAVGIVLLAAQFFFKNLWKTTLPLFIFAALLLVITKDDVSHSSWIVSRALTTGTVNERLTLAHIGWERFLQKPGLGWGAGALNVFGLRDVGTTSHNIYLTLLVDGGLLLFLSFLAIPAYLLFTVIRIYNMTDHGSLERHLLIAATGNVMIYLLSGMALELRYFSYFNTLFWISMGFIDRLTTPPSDGRIVLS
jgi:O-antigen ligase